MMVSSPGVIGKERSMQFERLVPMSGFLVAFALAGFAGGCGTSSSPAQTKEADKRIAKNRSERHKELKADAKTALQVKGEQSARRRGAHRGQ